MTIKWNNWRDNLKEATFRGVPFKVLSHTAEGGRRTFLHEFPFNDEPYLEDFGKAPGSYKIEAYICQSTENAFDYMPQRDAFRDALEQYGTGTLVHPFLGTLKVGVQGKYQLKESFAEGGIARFSLTFIDAGKPQQPSEQPPTPPDLDAKQTSLWTKFGKALQTANEIGHVVESALQQVQYYTNALQYALLLPVSLASSAVSQASTTVATIRASVDAVMTAPAQLAAVLKQGSQVFADMAALIQDSTSPTDTSLTDANLSMTTFGASFSTAAATTPDEQIVLNNQNIIVDTVRSSAMIEAVRSALTAEYGSYDEAVAMRDKLVAAFDYVMLGISQNSKDDEMYQAMADLKQYAADTMVFKGADLPTLRSLTVPVDIVPSLAYAQMLYADLSREAEIIAHNPVVMRHPGFPLGGEELKVLSE